MIAAMFDIEILKIFEFQLFLILPLVDFHILRKLQLIINLHIIK